MRTPEAGNGKDRIDGESARRILQRAAAEQQRLDNERADSWSIEELEEMAAEAGISSEALRAAVELHGKKAETAAAGRSSLSNVRPRRGPWAIARFVPGHWSTAVKGGALATAGGVGLIGLLLAFPAVAQAAFWALLLFLILVALLVALGAAPF